MQILGITIDKPFFRITLVEKTKKRTSILYLKTFPISDIDGVKQLYKTSFKGKICSSLAAKNILMREIEFRSNTHKHLDQIVAFQAEATSYLSDAEVLSIPFVIDQNKEKTSALLFTILRDGMKEQLDALKKIDINPDSISASPLALIHFIKWKMPHIQDAIVIDLGSEEWTCVCMDKGHLKKFHSIQGGIESLLDALWEDRKKILIPKEISAIAKQIDLLQLQKTLNSKLSAQMHSLRKELARIVYSFTHNLGQKPVFFTGRVDAFGQLQEFLEEALIDFISANLMEEIPKEEQKHAISIGLAVGYGPKSVQFLQEEFFPARNWKKMGLASIYLCLASIIFSFGIVWSSSHLLQSGRQKMIASLESGIKQWDPKLSKEIFSSDSEEEILDRWNKAIRVYSKEYPYMLQCPNVTEVISWIYHHPCLKEELDPIKIKSIRYQLVSFPKIDTPRDPYLVKIEMEFRTDNPQNARRFHESIYRGEAIADNTQDIQWEATENIYRISFFVKRGKNG